MYDSCMVAAECKGLPKCKILENVDNCWRRMPGSYGSGPLILTPPKVCQAQQVCGEMMCPLCTTEAACKTKVLVTMMQGSCSLSILPADDVHAKWRTAMPWAMYVSMMMTFMGIFIKNTEEQREECLSNATCNSKIALTANACAL